jgi:hypothetical protein
MATGEPFRRTNNHNTHMITLKSDNLSFSFPGIGEELHRLVEGHIQATLPRLLAEDRDEVVSALKSQWAFRNAKAEERKKAEDKVLKAMPAQIEAALRRKCMSRARLDRRDEFATVSVEFQRTLRIPDDGKVYPLPAGVGRFPLRHVDDHEKSVPASWLKRGGVMMPMHQSEALWLNFDAGYPFAMKVGAGKINAVTGEVWTAGLQREPQNYLVLPEQPWLDGFAVSKGIIRQFVAMPLGDGYSVEEQLTGNADVGGIQLQVFPMKAEAYFQKELAAALPTRLEDLLEELVGEWISDSGISYCLNTALSMQHCAEGMGLGAGGTMRQEIYDDPHDFTDWDTTATSRCFIHLCNSLVWRQITGSNPPHPPLTAKEYAKSGIPWFDHYRDDLRAVDGSKILGGVKSVAQLGKAKGTAPLPDNTTITPELIVQYGNARRPDEVREWVEP